MWWRLRAAFSMSLAAGCGTSSSDGDAQGGAMSGGSAGSAADGGSAAASGATGACDQASTIPYPLQAIDSGSGIPGSEATGCGLTSGGSPICWGGAGVVGAVHPGPFTRLEVSSTHEGMCGFRADGTLSCWDYTFRAGYPIPATTPP